MIPYLLLGIALAATLYASYTDIKTREVPNWVSFGLIGAMLVLRISYALIYDDLQSLWMCLASGGLFLGLGLLFFYSQQWGGADVKLLTAIGVGFGSLIGEFAPVPSLLWPFAITVLMNFFIVAIVYSLLFALSSAAKTPAVWKDFKASMNSYEQGLILAAFLGVAILAFYNSIFVWAGFIPLVWLLFRFLKPVEKHCMHKEVSVKGLVEFDIPENDIKVGRKVIVSNKDPNGITPEQIKEVQKLAKAGKVAKNLRVKWGVPLVPAFPVTILISLFYGDMIFVLLMQFV